MSSTSAERANQLLLSQKLLDAAKDSLDRATETLHARTVDCKVAEARLAIDTLLADTGFRLNKHTNIDQPIQSITSVNKAMDEFFQDRQVINVSDGSHKLFEPFQGRVYFKKVEVEQDGKHNVYVLFLHVHTAPPPEKPLLRSLFGFASNSSTGGCESLGQVMLKIEYLSLSRREPK